MDRVQQISGELIQLYREQLNIWELGKLGNVNEVDVLQYDQRRARISELWKELEGMRPDVQQQEVFNDPAN